MYTNAGSSSVAPQYEASYDGDSVSSIVVSTSVMAAVCVLLNSYENTWLYDVIDHSLLPVLRSAMGVFSIVFWIILWVLVKVKPGSYVTSHSRDHAAINFVLTLLWILSLGASVYFILSTIIDVQCAIEDLPSRKFYIASSVYRIIQPIFMLIQTIVMTEISKLGLRQSRLIRGFFLVILLTNLSSWLYNISSLQNKMSSKCFWSEEIATLVIDIMNPITLPMEQVYNFLSVCVTLSFFLSGHWAIPSAGHQTNSAQGPNWTSRNLVIYFALSILLSMPSFVIFVLRKTFNQYTYSNVWQLTTMFSNSVLILAMFYGFHCMRKMERKSFNPENPYNFFINDSIFIVCACGNFTFSALGICFECYRGASLISAVKYDLFMTETYYQTIFILCLKDIKGECYEMLQFVVIFLLFSNLMNWLFFQFWIFSISHSNTNEVLGSLYPVAKHLLYTVICFYRLQSFIYLYMFCIQ